MDVGFQERRLTGDRVMATGITALTPGQGTFTAGVVTVLSKIVIVKTETGGTGKTEDDEEEQEEREHLDYTETTGFLHRYLLLFIYYFLRGNDPLP